MNNSSRKMWLSCLVASCLLSIALAANEYLPPSKGYNYDVPKIPFPSRTPPPPPIRPTPPPPTRPNTYVPPPPTPTDHDHHHHEEHDHHHHHEPGMPFDFAYAVNEDGNDFSHNAKSDGDVTRGEYRIALPDGRTQIVRYTADWKNGFNAEVIYEGEARYPDQPSQQGGGYPSGPGQSYIPPNQGEGYHY
ncbi:cuticle protein 21-like [Maniola hyperantus]|uniref:cuticle protein 21-like n=1 Tax=Aphantopus hyperantus TaxID=2795564 RepID=UPI001569A9AF|nr:cuticle protein 21-like isoform X2 [Maniola hyperantus]